MTIPGFLCRISCHYSSLSPQYAQTWRSEQAASSENVEPLPLPEKKIPESLITSNLQQLQEAKKFWRINTLAISRFELAVYNPATHEDIVNMNLSETYNRIQRDTTLLHGPEMLGEGLDWGNMYAQLRSLSQVQACAAYSYLT
jgi:metallopeptidase MepB